jgi:hypothetical protein
MGLFDIFKGKENNIPGQHTPGSNSSGIQLGRYSDCNKTDAQLDHWDRSLALRKEGIHLDSFRELLDYIKDTALNNLSYSQNGNQIDFSFQQGSKIIYGRCSDTEASAECRIAAFTSPSVPVMRKLATLNYSLRYSWFAIHENAYAIRTRGLHADSSPTKFYWALREVAINADKQDDLIVEEFSTAQQVDTNQTKEVSEQIKEIKLRYLYKWIDETLEKIARLDAVKNNGIISYMLLTLNMKIDYLLAPEGILTDKLEKIQGLYNQKDKDYIQKNSEMIAAFREVREMTADQIKKSFYNTNSTFSIVSPASYKQVADFVFNESKTRDYYTEQRNYEAIVTIYEYVATYLFFNYGLKTPVKQLANLFLHIFNNDYYAEVGYSEKYRDSDGKLNRNPILSALQNIVAQNQKIYPGFQFRSQNLDFSSDYRFAITFFGEFDYLNLK